MDIAKLEAALIKIYADRGIKLEIKFKKRLNK